MDQELIINKLAAYRKVFKGLLSGISSEEYLWRPAPEKWCLLEIACHLYDEELYDFRARVTSVLENPEASLPPGDPVGWVKSKNYIGQDYDLMVGKFLNERDESVKWLQNLISPLWNNEYKHPVLGPLSAEFFVANWLAHDYLHFRQINTVKYAYFKSLSGIELGYAGDW